MQGKKKPRKSLENMWQIVFCDSEWQVQSAGHPRFWI